MAEAPPVVLVGQAVDAADEEGWVEVVVGLPLQDDQPGAILQEPAASSLKDDDMLCYGQHVTLQVANNEQRWLCGGRGGGSKLVETRDVYSDVGGRSGELRGLQNATAYTFVVRSANQFGIGGRTGDASEPLHGSPVCYGQQITLQVTNVDKRWLCGGRGGGNKLVETRDVHGDVGGKNGELRGLQNAAAYTFVVRSADQFGDGSRSHADPLCGTPVAHGQKIILQTANVDKRWLCGGRGGGNNLVETRDVYSDVGGRAGERRGLQLAACYHWFVNPTTIFEPSV